MVYVVSCPSQRSALIAHEVAGGLLPGRETITEYVTPAQARQAAMEKLVEQPEATDAPATDRRETDRHRASARISPTAMQAMEARLSCGGPQTPRLVVTGVEHVVAVLEQLENGLLASVPVIEPYACEGGCFGSPFLQEDYHVSLHRWEEAEKTLALDVTAADLPAPQAVPRRLPVTARPGIRLDADMGLAIEKLGPTADHPRSLCRARTAAPAAPPPARPSPRTWSWRGPDSPTAPI